MAPSEGDEFDSCPVCGKVFREEDRPEWLFVEITRSHSAEYDTDWTQFQFCSQAHAAQWLTDNPLPPLAPLGSRERSYGDRAFDVALLAVFLILVGLMLTGIVAILKWTVW